MKKLVQMDMFGPDQEVELPDQDQLLLIEIRAQISRAVKDSGLTQAEVSRRCGQVRFVRRLKESSDPSLRKLAQLARATGRRLVVRIE
jgi:hypothetical protein